MYLSKINIKNFRGINELLLEFNKKLNVIIEANRQLKTPCPYLLHKLKHTFYHHCIKSLQKSSAIQNNFITLTLVIIAIIVSNSLYFNAIKIQQSSLITKFSRIYNSLNSLTYY